MPCDNATPPCFWFEAIVTDLLVSGLSPRLPLTSVAILDTAGNNDGRVQRGEFVTPMLSFAAQDSENLRAALEGLDLRITSLSDDYRVIRRRSDLGIGVDSVVTTRGAEILVSADAQAPLRLELTSTSPYTTWRDTIEIPLASGEDETPPRVSYLRARSYRGEVAQCATRSLSGAGRSC